MEFAFVIPNPDGTFPGLLNNKVISHERSTRRTLHGIHTTQRSETCDTGMLLPGVYGRNKVDVKKKIDIRKSCVTAGDSPLLDRLLEILGWFETWRRELEPFFPGVTDIKAFITRESWFDMQLAILGFVALSRYLFSNESLVDEGGRRRYLFPRDFSQASISLLHDAKFLELFLIVSGEI